MRRDGAKCRRVISVFQFAPLRYLFRPVPGLPARGIWGKPRSLDNVFRLPYGNFNLADQFLADFALISGLNRQKLFLKPIIEALGSTVMISPRERTIARLVAACHPNKTIAHALRISTWTVSTHLRRIFAKLGVNSRAAMVAHLMETGVLKEPVQKQRKERWLTTARSAEI